MFLQQQDIAIMTPHQFSNGTMALVEAMQIICYHF